jgi:hypothetical protein
MRYEDREICFAPVFGARGLFKCILLNTTVVPAMLIILVPLFVIVALVTAGRPRPRGEVACAIKRTWYEARHCRRGNDDATAVL